MTAHPRHCFVALPFHVVEHPALILEWEDKATDAGTVRRYLVTYVHEEDGRSVTQWVPAEQVRRA